MAKKYKILCALFLTAVLALYYFCAPWGYYWKVDPTEQKLRDGLVERAESYLGYNEADGSHMEIVQAYNSQDPLPVDYALTEKDSWCAAFVTVAAAQQGLTHIIPPECGCERQIGLFQQLGRWEEKDSSIPLPGDLIYYDWEPKTYGECTGWADHVGIVVGTKWPFIKVIEGNYGDRVAYHYLFINDIHIRGFAKPDYSSKNIP